MKKERVSKIYLISWENFESNLKVIRKFKQRETSYNVNIEKVGKQR